MQTIKPQTVTLIEQARQVETILGEKCSIWTGPSGAIIRSKNGGITISLAGPNSGGWRNANRRQIELLRQVVSAITPPLSQVA